MVVLVVQVGAAEAAVPLLQIAVAQAALVAQA
jgi:hypothetical protein